jgi:hypothetical protein
VEVACERRDKNAGGNMLHVTHGVIHHGPFNHLSEFVVVALIVWFFYWVVKKMLHHKNRDEVPVLS